jgi:hypothetical protein
MKKIIPFIVFLCCFETVFHAQPDTFDLSRYRLPDIKFRQLDLNFNIDGSSSLQNRDYDENLYKQSSFSSDNNLNMGYRSYRNTQRFQNEQSFRIGINPGLDKIKSDSGITFKNLAFNSFIDLTIINRIYFQNKFFFEPDIHIYGSTNLSKEDDNVEFTLTKSSDASAEIEIPLLVGHGRIEQIQDARLAVYIFEELFKAGRITRIPGDAEILEFARLISELKNERYFDYRLKKMEEIEKVDSFLQSKGLITSADARYFTIVNDNWDYAQGPVREAGKRFSAGLIPEYSYLYSNLETTYSDPTDTTGLKLKRNILGIRMQGLYELERPVNLHWQRSFAVKMSYGYSRNISSNQYIEEPENKSSSDQLNLEAELRYGMGYFPNSRTNITGQVSLDFRHANLLKNQDNPDLKFNNFLVAPLFDLAVYYYVSPQFRFILHYRISYNYTKSNYRNEDPESYFYLKSNALNQNFNAGFTYSIF